MELQYSLHDLQYRIYLDKTRFIVLAAGRRFGKTVLSIVKIIDVASSIPNARVWYIAPTYRQAETIAWKMLIQLIPKELIAKKNEVKLEIILRNGSEIALKGAENEDGLVGSGLHYVILDEYALFKPHVWEQIVRPMLSDTQGGAMFISTPRGKNQFWELWMRGERGESNYASYRCKTEDNPFIPRSEVKDAKDQLNERYFRQEYEASFEDYTGLVYPEFNQKKHVIDPIVLPDYCNKVGALDPAMTGTTACLFASIDEDGTLYITSEYYEKNKRVGEVSDAIKGKAEVIYGDPAGQHKAISRNGTLYSIFDEYKENGIVLIPAQNNVSFGINKVAEMFKAGKIKIFKNCVNLIHELERYHWSEEKETSSGVLEPKPYKALDHATDCLRYIVASRPESPIEKKVQSYEASCVSDPFVSTEEEPAISYDYTGEIGN
jgi:phage terminase large subunit